ncbi:M20/M25/M40 family metallo-hydrolase [Croceicoccus bisphenolivorans]|uniref:M20/M25/M40 family metallo-hydrolase n=1 Tax=Croceicoccus bisphenolivorans TaxID=1783232 RepID=UPI000AC30CE5|nr:M20/M25/M40 family metallo-hydrolase [Croceicoccus bisphenolivorans]
MKTAATLAASALMLGVGANAIAADGGRAAFIDTYRELVETNTTLSSGSCTLAAKRMAARLSAAGMAEENLHLFAVPEHPEEGGLVAIYPGSGAKEPILLMAHIDVVEAEAGDWKRDPFTFVQEDGFFYGRGTSDDKAQAAIWTDMLVRFAQEGYRPSRTIKVALTCGEETNGAFNGAEWLAKERRDLIDAAFALNEGGGGDLDENGKVAAQSVQVGEKIFANFELTTRNAGGHSALPRPDNAIYQLADALKRVEAVQFPVEFTDVTRRSFREAGAAMGGKLGAAMIALANDPSDITADAVVSTDPFWRGNTRTTCVATTLQAGHARNALPRRAVANVNCRIFPGNEVAAIRQTLVDAIADEVVEVTLLPPARPSFETPPLDPVVMDPIAAMVAKWYPDAKLTVAMSNGYTDSAFTNAAGIPTYGVPGLWSGPEGTGAHGLDEHIAVDSVLTARDFLTDLVRAYAD